jgi:hypothetical protein
MDKNKMNNVELGMGNNQSGRAGSNLYTSNMSFENLFLLLSERSEI